MRVLTLILFLYPMHAFSQLKCIHVYSKNAPIFGKEKGKGIQTLSQIETYFRAGLKEGDLLLFRGQRRLTKRLPSIVSRESGVAESKKFLEEAVQEKNEELEESRAWLKKMIAKNCRYPAVLTAQHPHKKG